MEIKLLSCPLCLKPHFEGVDALRSSLINVATSHLSCPVCSESLLGLDKLTIHLFSHIANTVAEIKEVPNSDDVVVAEVATQQQKESSVEPIESENSVENCTSAPNEDANCIYCDICNFCFNDENILEMHQKLLHQTTPDKNTGEYSYHCHLCSKKFKMKGSLMVHLRVAHYGFGHNETSCRKVGKEIAEEIAQSSFDDGESQQELTKKSSGSSKQDNKQWECDVCSKMFTTKYFLKKHKRLHTGEMPYYCGQCNKSFTFQQSYHKHMLYHSADKPHVCSECGRAFKELSTLHNHERIHSGERPFTCETCGKSFRQRVSYLVHRRIHTGAMPYKCPSCDKSFRYKVSQRSHKCPGNTLNNDLPQKMELTAATPADSVFQGRNSIELYSTAEYSIKLLDNHISIDNITNSSVPNFENSGGYNFSLVCANMGLNGQNFQLVEANEKPPMEILENSDKNGVNNIQPIVNRSTLTGSNIAINSDLKGNGFPMTCTSENGNTDFFSMVLSPLLPEVQSLCIDGSAAEATDNNTQEDKREVLKTINEESLKELLYGSTKNC